MSESEKIALKFVERAGPYASGDVYSFYPEQAKRLVSAGIAVYVNKGSAKKKKPMELKKTI